MHLYRTNTLRIARRIPGLRALNRLLFRRETPSLARNIFGIDFPGPVGLGEGIDRFGELYNCFADFGFSFVELSSQPDILRTIANIQKDRPQTILAANLSPDSKSTEEAAIIHDFCTSFSLMYDFADLFVVNTSHQRFSGGSSLLEDISFLSEILDELLSLRLLNDHSKPLLIQVSRTIDRQQLEAILHYALYSGIDGIVASGLESVRFIHEYTQGRLPIIARGEMHRPEDAAALLDAGASLLELTGEEVRPGSVRRITEYLSLPK